jgi:cellobiose phosphorylase
MIGSLNRPMSQAQQEATMRGVLAVAAWLIAANGFAAETTWLGDLMTTACVGAHTSKFHSNAQGAHDCAQDCIKEGAKYVFVSDGRIYQIVNQKNGALKSHVGHTVKVMGDLKGDAISVSKIEAASEAKSR